MLIILSGPSGSGKGSVCKKVLEKFPLKLSISVTTRSPRDGEKNGIDYYFVSKEEFQNLIANNQLLEWAKVYDDFYGTPMELVHLALEQDEDVILEIDVQGALTIKEKYPDAVLVFIITPTKEELERRLINRSTESMEKIKKRMDWVTKEIPNIKKYDYVLINDDLQQTADNFIALIKAEKCKAHRVSLSAWDLV